MEQIWDLGIESSNLVNLSTKIYLGSMVEKQSVAYRDTVNQVLAFYYFR